MNNDHPCKGSDCQGHNWGELTHLDQARVLTYFNRQGSIPHSEVRQFIYFFNEFGQCCNATKGEY